MLLEENVKEFLHRYQSIVGTSLVQWDEVRNNNLRQRRNPTGPYTLNSYRDMYIKRDLHFGNEKGTHYDQQ